VKYILILCLAFAIIILTAQSNAETPKLVSNAFITCTLSAVYNFIGMRTCIVLINMTQL